MSLQLCASYSSRSTAEFCDDIAFFLLEACVQPYIGLLEPYIMLQRSFCHPLECEAQHIACERCAAFISLGLLRCKWEDEARTRNMEAKRCYRFCVSEVYL